MKKGREKIKKIISTFLTIIMFVSYILPTTVIATNERVDYSVTILPGEGKIQTSPDEFTKGADTRSPYIDYCPSEKFEDVDKINVKVRENENIKNKIDYDRTITFWLWDRYITVNPWDNVGYITDTRIVNRILNNGIDTVYGNSKGEFGDCGYSDSCRKVYLFVPPENKNFSHFIDQDGNIFSLGDTVTKDLILTPVYVEEEVETTFMNKKVHNVTFLKGEGQIVKRDERADKNMGYKDKITYQTYEGDTTFYNIASSYAKFKYSDYEKGIIALEERKKISFRCS